MSDLFLVRFPRHDAGLFLEHNPHLNLYESVERYLTDSKTGTDGIEVIDWEQPADREESIRTGELWTLQWYSDTPVGFHSIAAPTFEKLLAYALKVEEA